MQKKYFDVAYREASKAYFKGEVPVGCVIVYKNKILAKAHNLKESMKDSTSHAEILAIRKASKKLNDWRLNECVLYTTLKPCLMCMGAIFESRISEVNYIVETEDYKNYYNEININKNKYLEEESLCLLKSFFNNKRK